MTVTHASSGPTPVRPWLAHYPAAVPSEIDAAKLGTLADLIREACATFPNRAAFESFGKTISFSETGKAAQSFAAWLQGQGFKKGDRIALMMPNILAYPATIFGALLGGYTVVNVNPLYTARELTHQLNDSGARALVVIENFAHVVEEARPNLKLDAIIVATAGDLMGFKGSIVNFVARKIKKVVKPFNLPGFVSLKTIFASQAVMAPVTVTPDDVAFLQYTGGTTGVAKGCDADPSQCLGQCRAMRALARLGAGSAAGAQRLPACDGHRAAALPHLRADLLLHVHAAHRRQGAADRQSARHPRLHQDAQDEPHHAVFRRQHALQRAGPAPRDQGCRLLRAALRGRGRHGHPGRRRQALEGRDRPPHRRGLRPVRDLAGGLDQPARHHGILRHDRLSAALHRHDHPRCREQRHGGGRAGRDLHPGAAGDGGLLEAPGRDGQGDDGRTVISALAMSA